MTEQDQNEEKDLLRVGANSPAKAVASAIAHSIYETRTCKIRAVGAGAINQAIKACAIARGYTAPRGLDIGFIPGFTTIKTHDGDVSALVLTVFVIN